MRISEIIVEVGFIDQFKSAVAQNKQKGYDAVNKIINPTEWGAGSTAKSSDTKSNLNIKDAVSRAAQGLIIYDAEEQALLSAANSVKAGKIETNLDPAELSNVLKAAAQGQKLNDQQKNILNQFLQEI